MAVTWTVTPSEGVVNNNDGTFEFSANTTFCNKTYIIEYKDTGDGCACNAVFTQVGKDCSTTYGDDIWDDYDCSLHPGQSITVNGYYWVYPKHVEGCSTCIEDPSYTASTSMTVSCPTPCCDGFSVGNIDYCRDGTGGNLGNCGTLDCSSSDCCDNITNMSASSSASWLSDPVDTQDAEGDWHFRAVCEPMKAGSGPRECTCTAYFTCGSKTTSVSWTVKQWDVPCD